MLSLANSPTPILHSYLFTPYPANGCYAPLCLLHVFDACISREKSCSHEGLLFMLFHTTRITTLIVAIRKVKHCYLTNWDICSSRSSQTECRSCEYHTAFTVGHFHFQHPCMFLFRLLNKSTSPKSSGYKSSVVSNSYTFVHYSEAALRSVTKFNSS